MVCRVIRVFAMRLDLCRLVDEGKISLETGIAIYELERQRAIMKRVQAEANPNRQRALPDENQEPLG
jgi:hypothetical protein